MAILNNLRYTSAQSFSVDLFLAGSREPDAIFLAFQEFNCTQDVIEICEVTSKARVVRTKLPANVKYDNLLLLRGSSYSLTFWDWFNLVQDGNWSKQRRDASIVIYDPSRKSLVQFDLQRAWPASYKISDLDSRSQDVHIESLEVAFESMKRVQL